MANRSQNALQAQIKTKVPDFKKWRCEKNSDIFTQTTSHKCNAGESLLMFCC